MTRLMRAFIVVTLVSPAGCTGEPHDDKPAAVETGTAPSLPGSVPCADAPARDEWRYATFVPPTRRADATIEMPLVFPDGTTAVLTYPRDLRLAEMGIRTSVAVSGDDLADEQGTTLGLGRYRPHRSLVKGQTAETCFEGRHGLVEAWRARSKDYGPDALWVLFPLHGWTAYTYATPADSALDHDEIAAWAAALGARRVGRWVVIEPRRPLEFGWKFSRSARPAMETQIQIGGLDPNGILLWPLRCKGSEKPTASDIDDKERFANWCDPGGMLIHVYSGSGDFIRRVLTDVEVTGVRPAFSLPRYTIVP